MLRYEKIRPNLYGLDMLYGKIDLKPTHGFSCFFIVEHIEDNDFIKRQAMQFLLAGCRDFNLYGKTEYIWRVCVADVNLLLNQNAASETMTLISCWNTLEEFVDVLGAAIAVRSFIPHDYYIIYDDKDIYKEALKMLYD